MEELPIETYLLILTANADPIDKTLRVIHEELSRRRPDVRHDAYRDLKDWYAGQSRDKPMIKFLDILARLCLQKAQGEAYATAWKKGDKFLSLYISSAISAPAGLANNDVKEHVSTILTKLQEIVVLDVSCERRDLLVSQLMDSCYGHSFLRWRHYLELCWPKVKAYIDLMTNSRSPLPVEEEPKHLCHGLCKVHEALNEIGHNGAGIAKACEVIKETACAWTKIPELRCEGIYSALNASIG
ncbi:hypothetical protein AX16_002878 [Volvariella volvacea WC 439]|nr:hypothetical protein AX16_002878 [Volvariella volvacea WC 439]